MIRAPRGPIIPEIKDNSVESIRSLRKALVEAIDTKHTKTTPLEEVLVSSPSGFVYAILVSDSGELFTELRSTP